MPIKRSLATRVGIDVLRKKYPTPKPAWTEGRTRSDYSVGGALCSELCVELGYAKGEFLPFPINELVAEALCLCNNNLPKHQALSFAREINQRSDEGQFEDAWSAMENAFDYR